MANKTVELTSHGQSKVIYAYAEDSCGNIDWFETSWSGSPCSGCGTATETTVGGNRRQPGIKVTAPSSGTVDNSYTLTWKSSSTSGGLTAVLTVKVKVTQSKEKICPSLQINGRQWDLRLDVPAASNVDYLFDATNGYESDAGTSTDDISLTITISKGNKVGQFRTTQFEFAVYAILVSVDPYEDDTYIYGDCDVEWGNV